MLKMLKSLRFVLIKLLPKLPTILVSTSECNNKDEGEIPKKNEEISSKKSFEENENTYP